MGRLQFDFLVSEGLRPSDYLLDVGCGSLRGGVHFIGYLEPGHYLGLEKNEALLQAGLEHELMRQMLKDKTPEFIVSHTWEVHRFRHKPDIALAQSVFTHLTAFDIQACLKAVRSHVAPGTVFYATFFASPRPVENPPHSEDNTSFHYTTDQMIRFGADNGWRSEYIGHWNHPRGQVMMMFLAT